MEILQTWGAIEQKSSLYFIGHMLQHLPSIGTANRIPNNNNLTMSFNQLLITNLNSIQNPTKLQFFDAIKLIIK